MKSRLEIINSYEFYHINYLFMKNYTKRVPYEEATEILQSEKARLELCCEALRLFEQLPYKVEMWNAYNQVKEDNIVLIVHEVPNVIPPTDQGDFNSRADYFCSLPTVAKLFIVKEQLEKNIEYIQGIIDYYEETLDEEELFS